MGSQIWNRTTRGVAEALKTRCYCAHERLFNADGKGNPCQFFKHFSIIGGFRLLVVCKYESKEAVT